MDKFLTETGTHKNNPTGAALNTVASGIAITPVDPADESWRQEYPQEKLFLMRQTFTEYTAFAAGDLLVVDSTTYTVRVVHPWSGQSRLGTYYKLLLEAES